jgi:hypothetical protein
LFTITTTKAEGFTRANYLVKPSAFVVVIANYLVKPSAFGVVIANYLVKPLAFVVVITNYMVKPSQRPRASPGSLL